MKPEIEAALVGKLMFDDESVKFLDGVLEAGLSFEHFSNPNCRDIFAAILEADRQGTGRGPVDICARLPHLASDIATAVTVGVDAKGAPPYLARLIKAESWRRKTAMVFSDLGKDLLGIPDLLDEMDHFKARVSAKIEAAIDDRDHGAKDVFWFNEAMPTLMERLEQRFDDYRSGRGKEIQTGIPTVDTYLGGGLKPKSLTMIGARTGMGKTTLALLIALNAARRGLSVVIFTLEMDREEIEAKLTSSCAGVSANHLLRGDTLGIEFQLRKHIENNKDLKIGIHDFANGDFNRIISDIRRLHRRGKCDIAFIDYLGLLEAPHKKWFDRRSELAFMTKALKNMSIELSLPIVLLSQLNRDAEKDDEPELRHFRDSGSIEQDCDNALLLFREPGAPEEVEVIKVAKARWGKRDKKVQISVDFGKNIFTELEV